MDNLTIVLVLVLVVLAYLVYRHHENMEDGSGSKCIRNNEPSEYQTNEVNYNGSDVESSYFNQLERNKTWNERQSWLNNMQLEAKRQSTHS